jgi:hypothetical protein
MRGAPKAGKKSLPPAVCLTLTVAVAQNRALAAGDFSFLYSIGYYQIHFKPSS